MLIGKDCSLIDFCIGPCVSTVEESSERKFLKPFSGNRYKQMTWQLRNGDVLDLRNVRVCVSCNARYKEMKDGAWDYDYDCMEMMHDDAEIIIRKLAI